MGSGSTCKTSLRAKTLSQMLSLKEKGITGKLANWLLNWLSPRTQQVLVNGSMSRSSPVTSGVPQGSVLGPLLFLIMIDSIVSCEISGWISIFADDTRCGRSIRNMEDAFLLQEDLELLYNWKTESNMEFNSSKFEVLQYGQNESLKNDYTYTTPECESFIERKSSVKDLGIQMTDSATFDQHIHSVITKVKRIMGWIRRTFLNRSPNFLVFLWKTYCLPLLDYGSQLWAPSQPGHLESLEGLLRTYTSWIQGVSHLSYWEHLSALRLNSVQRRFERYRTIYCWKIVQGLVPNCGLSWTSRPVTGKLCLLPLSSSTATSRTKTLRKSSFQFQGPALYNSLPAELRDLSCTVETFKQHLDKHLGQFPDLPLVHNGLLPPPVNAITARNSNSIIDWALFLRVLRRP